MAIVMPFYGRDLPVGRQAGAGRAQDEFMKAIDDYLVWFSNGKIA